MQTAGDIATAASKLVSGDRQNQHGDKLDNFQRIAALWDVYITTRKNKDKPLDALDVGHMMVLLKIARTQSGTFNPDDYIDMTGYSACAGDVAHTLHARSAGSDGSSKTDPSGTDDPNGP